MKQFTVYIDETTIPMIVTDDDITQMADNVIGYINKWTRQYNSNDIHGMAMHVFLEFFENYCYDKLGCTTEEEFEDYYLQDEEEDLIAYEILSKIPVKIQ